MACPSEETAGDGERGGVGVMGPGQGLQGEEPAVLFQHRSPHSDLAFQVFQWCICQGGKIERILSNSLLGDGTLFAPGPADVRGMVAVTDPCGRGSLPVSKPGQFQVLRLWGLPSSTGARQGQLSQVEVSGGKI